MIRDALQQLVSDLLADGELSDADLVTIHNATVGRVQAIQTDKAWAERIHVHDVPHVPKMGTNKGGDILIDASGSVCHDCGRQLVSDAGTVRVLVCPQIHGRRQLTPETPDGAVECGDAVPH